MIDAVDVTIDVHNSRGWPKSVRQLEWARLYVVEGYSAHDAALKVGYATTTAKAKSYALVKRLGPFLAHLQTKKNSVAQVELRVTSERVVQELAAIAFPRIGSYYKAVTLKDGTRRVVGKSPEELTEEQAPAVKSWTVIEHEGKDGKILDYQYAFHDPLKALNALGKHMGLFNEQIQVELRHDLARRSRPDLSTVPNEVLERSIETLERVRRDLLIGSGIGEGGGDSSP